MLCRRIYAGKEEKLPLFVQVALLEVFKLQWQDSVGIPTLNAQGRHCGSNFDKASILNEFFQSVFTKENVDDMPETAPFPFATMGNIIVSVSGISKS